MADKSKKSTTANSGTGRPTRMTPKAGYTKKPRRYGCGGKLKK